MRVLPHWSNPKLTTHSGQQAQLGPSAFLERWVADRGAQLPGSYYSKHRTSWIVPAHFVSQPFLLQKYDKGVQLNSALFTGTQGWVLKPASIRSPADEKKRVAEHDGKKKHLFVDIKGASALTLPAVSLLLLVCLS